MKLAFCSGRNSPHTVRWVNSLAQRGHEILLISVHCTGDPLDSRIKIKLLPFPPGIGYYLNSPLAAVALRQFAPDLLHIHSASGYGTLGRLMRFHPCILSVWGSDVYDVPWQSPTKRKIVLKNLHNADFICSTSHCMAAETKRLCPEIEDITVTPFGIDIDKFFPNITEKKEEIINVGTVKRLEQKYAVDTLIKAFAKTRDDLQVSTPDLASKLRLTIVGEGSELESLILLSEKLDVNAVTEFVGAIPHDQVPSLLNSFDIFVALSRLDSESFGVAILEASACNVPVVVSNVSGFAEVVEDNKTGLIVPRDDVVAASNAIMRLVQSEKTRRQLGCNGRTHVKKKYDWEYCVDLMEQVYEKVLS
ncbi:MAG: glycosyltransferase [Desulfocapsa sp.]|nr:glycosyltransferase [Desulfocapsa sp.]